MATIVMSARFPGSRLPVRSPMCIARAPPMVASSSVCRAGKIGRIVAFDLGASSAASRISSNMSKSLLLAGPSVPIPTLSPPEHFSNRRNTTGQFEVAGGLCATPALLSSTSTFRHARRERNVRRVFVLRMPFFHSRARLPCDFVPGNRALLRMFR